MSRLWLSRRTHNWRALQQEDLPQVRRDDDQRLAYSWYRAKTDSITSLTTRSERRTKMPRGDRTGPAGMGPMTGRAAGLCAGYGVPGYMNPAGGRGYWGRGGGWSCGGGWGRRNWYNATGLPGWARAERGWPAWGSAAGLYAAGAAFAPDLTAGQQLDALKSQADYLEGALGEINKRIEELKTQRSAEERV